MGMFGNAFTGWHLLVVLAVILLLFGAAKLPALAKSMGQSARLFRGELKAMKTDDAAPDADRVEPGATDPAQAPVRPVTADDVARGSSTSSDARP